MSANSLMAQRDQGVFRTPVRSQLAVAEVQTPYDETLNLVSNLPTCRALHSQQPDWPKTNIVVYINRSSDTVVTCPAIQCSTLQVFLYHRSKYPWKFRSN